jgi:hypothetical protein
MRDFGAEAAEVDAAERDLENAIERMVALILSDVGIFSAQAGGAVSDVGRFAARSVAAAVRRAEIDWQRNRLIHVLDALGPPDEPAIVQELERLAEEDPDEDVRDHAQYVLDDMRRRELLEAEAEL